MIRTASALSLPLIALFTSVATPSRVAAADTLHLSMGQAMENARHSGFGAQTAGSRARESDARIDEARSALLPHVGATASDVVRSYNPSTFGLTFPGTDHVDPFQVQDARVGGRLTVWDAAAWKRYRSAQRGGDRAEWERKSGEDDAAMAAGEAYLALLRARSLIKARVYEVELAAQLDTLTRAQKKAGAVSQLEVLRARGQLSAARMALAAATGEEASARAELLEALGLPIDLELVTTDTLALASEPVLQAMGDPDAAAQGRPEIAAAAAEVEAVQADLAASKAGLLPTVEASGDYGLSGRRIYTGGAQWTEDAALQLNWSLWDGGGRGARVRQQEEKLRQARLRLADLRARAGREARLERTLLAVAREKSERAAERAALAEEEAHLAAEQFRAGTAGNLEVITAQGSVSAAHAASVDALYGYQRTRLAALRSLNLLGSTAR